MITYILSILILWLLIVVLMVSDRKNRAYQWLSATLFLGSFVGIGDILLDLSKNISSENSRLLLNLGIFFNIGSCAFYYTYINYTFCSSKLLTDNKFWKKYFWILTLLPTILVFSLIKKLNLEYENSMLSLIIWKNVYSLIGYVFLTSAIFVKKNQKNKQQHLKEFLFVVPTVIFIHFLNDYAFVTGNFQVHKNNFWVIIYVLAVYIFFLNKDGFMGMRIKIEKSKIQGNFEALNMTNAFLTHDFKNEIIKINEFLQKIKSDINYLDNPELIKWFSLIDNSKEKLDKMLERIRNTSNEGIVINKARHSINEMINTTLSQLTYGEKERSLISIEIDESIILICDLDYTSKVIINVLDNAYEAIKGKGEINLRAYSFDEFCVIEIRDNGPGIKKEDMEHIMKPFFSTKTMGSNMGLGLTYCYNILNMSGGEIHIQSAINKGTTVSIYIERA